jgi:hypothetical protein
VALTWDGENLATVDLDDRGAFTMTFLVPETASPDTSHTVEARCVGDGRVTASAEFTVTPPVPVPAIVPDLVGLTIDEAQVALEEVGLELGGVSGDGDRIRSQGPFARNRGSPGNGRRCHPGSAGAATVHGSEPVQAERISDVPFGGAQNASAEHRRTGRSMPRRSAPLSAADDRGRRRSTDRERVAQAPVGDADDRAPAVAVRVPPTSFWRDLPASDEHVAVALCVGNSRTRAV